MASADRPAPDHLTFLAESAATARRFGLFALVRRAEARAGALPRLGRSKRPALNVVDLAQAPTLAFPGSTIDAIRVKDGRAKVDGFWLGLTGPMGALPTHLTEFAVYERRYGRTQPFGDFLDMLSGRMLQLFYRAWADSQPAAQADRPWDDRFGTYLGALSGAMEGVAPDAVFPAPARLHYAAVFAGRRSSAAIEDALTHLLGLPAEVIDFQPRWRDIERDEQTSLGRRFATIGADAVVGRRVRVVSDAFRIVLRAKDFSSFETLLPSGIRFPLAAEALDAFAPDHLEWDIQVELDERHAPPARLDGRSRLGWGTWLAPAGREILRRDVRLRRGSLRKGKRQGGVK
ncbi:MAG TPA: type VI secretion system baseplate subunit TssG [Allosphingosinicella sp.]|jgi:type VI secretion system protein ImpH